MKSNEKSLAKNHFLKNALEKGWVQPMGMGTLGTGGRGSPACVWAQDRSRRTRGASSSRRHALWEEFRTEGWPPGHPPCALYHPCCGSVHRGWLVALGGLGILGERRLLVVVHSGAWVGGIGRAGVWSGVHVVLEEVVYPGLVALVGQGGQQALQGVPRLG